VPGEIPLAARSRRFFGNTLVKAGHLMRLSVVSRTVRGLALGHGSLRAMRRKSESIESSQRIDSAELVARRLSNFVDGPSNIPRITWHMRLPGVQVCRAKPVHVAATVNVTLSGCHTEKAIRRRHRCATRSWMSAMGRAGC